MTCADDDSGRLGVGCRGRDGESVLLAEAGILSVRRAQGARYGLRPTASLATSASDWVRISGTGRHIRR
jgi:hypothetical protein